MDNDGDLDILVLNLNDTPRLLRNDGGNRSHWLSIRARGTRSNRDALGTRVRLTAGGVTQVADVRSSSGYLSQGDLRVHFGLGAAAKAERIEIRWPDGGVQVLENVTADRIVTVTEPASD
ncbi:ASPIC/UnbV domain-containing protein [Desulfuromonas sp.]|uniref:ASPIC/UnbV domain-containing protein n=1 Tax=Desulfuromonas sp. TaxID=892 RepID=UPI0025BC987C|nr:ASPIC/UnbV domain-containing protein [Desulfuromonas sp.]